MAKQAVREVPAEENLPVAPTSSQVVAVDDDALAEYSGQGNENVTRDDMATPFIFLLQDLSPQVKRTEAKYVQGAQAGMFLNSVTNVLYDGATGLDVIDCFFEPLLLKWKPRNAGGGFRGVVDPNDPILKECKRKIREESGEEVPTLITPSGDEINNTNQHHLLTRPHVTEGENPYPWQPVVLGMNSTQIKKSKTHNARLNLERVTTKDGRQVPIPRFGVVFHMTAEVERKGANSWWGIRLERMRRVTPLELQEGKAFYEAVARGERRAVPTEDTHGADPAPAQQGREPVSLEDDIPY